jgi:TorA maturation chaperone TorD
MDRLQARSHIYNTLSAVVAFPGEDVRSAIREGLWQNGLQQSFNILDEGYFSGCLEEFQNACSAERMASPQQLADEYDRLFGGSLPDPDGGAEALACMGKIWSLLKGHDCKTAASSDEFDRLFRKTRWPLADMLAHRFRLMGILAELETNSTCSEKIQLEELQLDFVSRFIAPSIPKFCETVIRTSSLDFYHAIGILMQEFVKFEANYLGIPEEMDAG